MEKGSVVDAQIELEEIEPKANHLGRYWWIDWFVYDEYYKIPRKIRIYPILTGKRRLISDINYVE